MSQTGGAVASAAITAIGVPAVVAVRQLVAAAILLPIARPKFRRLTRPQIGSAIALGVATTCMNLGLYTAIDRIGLALAVTLEFLGPLAIAIAGTRTIRDGVAAVAAAAGVYVLVNPNGSADWFGIGSALGAAASWAAYILLNRRIGRQLPGLHGAALSASVSAALSVPVVIVLAALGCFSAVGVLLAVVTGVMCSVVPMAADLFALRRVPARLFGVLASINPVAAAAAAIVLLHEIPTLRESIGIVVIVAANIAATVPTVQKKAAAGRNA